MLWCVMLVCPPSFSINGWLFNSFDASSFAFRLYFLILVHFLFYFFDFSWLSSCFIMMLIISMSWIVFAFDVTALAERMNILLALFLASVAYKSVVADKLPKISYNTTLDKYKDGDALIGDVYILNVNGFACGTGHSESRSSHLCYSGDVYAVHHFRTSWRDNNF